MLQHQVTLARTTGELFSYMFYSLFVAVSFAFSS